MTSPKRESEEVRADSSARKAPAASAFGRIARALIGLIVIAAAAGIAVHSLASCDRGSLRASYNELRGDPYPFDDLDRSVTADAGPECPGVELEHYRGETVRFSPPAQVAVPFLERLRRLESVTIEVAKRHYGRAPERLVNAGAYLCRSVRHRSYRLSEHALGNAIDVVGFDFGPLAAAPDGGAPDAGITLNLPPSLHRKFQVRVERHWQSGDGDAGETHSRFLADLTRTLIEQRVFRTVLGPSHPTHRTHFHFDMAPWSHFNP